MKTFKQFLKESNQVLGEGKNYRYEGYLITPTPANEYGVVVYAKNGITVLAKGLKSTDDAEKFIDERIEMLNESRF